MNSRWIGESERISDAGGGLNMDTLDWILLYIAVVNTANVVFLLSRR